MKQKEGLAIMGKYESPLMNLEGIQCNVQEGTRDNLIPPCIVMLCNVARLPGGPVFTR